MHWAMNATREQFCRERERERELCYLLHPIQRAREFLLEFYLYPQQRSDSNSLITNDNKNPLRNYLIEAVSFESTGF
jgi:hypothetical protein